MAFDADRFLKVAVGLGILTAGVGVGYHYGIYLPQSERLKIERSERIAREQKEANDSKESKRKERYISCLDLAYENYRDGWEQDCKRNGYDNRGPNCSLPKYNADSWNKGYKEDRDQCLDEFKLGV